ncbi:hypothetical protein DM860_016340 [Cuscuta australis]|uniref:Uncharacterized protein n=1 Tax=Cuscuta australis TaxID=267555 RepID=A0A328D8D3_9ASTE|nr:hypothetical protein DM860_016340 [Cuscuta australis]
MSHDQHVCETRKRIRDDDDDDEMELNNIVTGFIIVLVGAWYKKYRVKESHPPASSYRNKTIDNWVDICILFGSDRALGDGAEQFDEAAMAMDEEMTSEGMSTSTGSVSKKASGKEIHEVVSKVDGILRHQVLKAVKKFMNMPNEFQMLKDLPEDEKLDWILLCLKE